MSDLPISILSITVHGEETPSGAMRLAFVDVAIGPIRLNRCSLLRIESGKHIICGPSSGISKTQSVTAAHITDMKLRDQVMEKALAAYKALSDD